MVEIDLCNLLIKNVRKNCIMNVIDFYLICNFRLFALLIFINLRQTQNRLRNDNSRLSDSAYFLLNSFVYVFILQVLLNVV
jgi:hypothetical protein